jgi:hypothetical protein
MTPSDMKRHIIRLQNTPISMGNYKTVVSDALVVMREMAQHIEVLEAERALRNAAVKS